MCVGVHRHEFNVGTSMETSSENQSHYYVKMICKIG